MDEHPLAKHGNFARELDDLEHLGVPVEETPAPASFAIATMIVAAMLVTCGGLILVSAALKHLFGLDILLYDRFAQLVVFVLFGLAMIYLPTRRQALPEPWPLRHMSDKALRTWRGVSWFVALAYLIVFTGWAAWGREAPLLVEARNSGDVDLLVKAGLDFFGAAAGWVPLVFCQIAVEARRRGS